MKLSLGPVPWFWDRETLFDFYERVEDWPVDRVYLGETVCSKRRALRTREWIDLAAVLALAGKEVVLSTLTLIEARSEAATLRRLCRAGLPIEANDYSAVAVAEEAGIPFIGGSTLNLYSREAIDVLVRAGMRTWVPPIEMSAEQLDTLMANDRPPVEVELFAFGRMPLAWSARCFAARAHGRPKDDCGFVCRDYPDGLAMQTQEGADFLVINGIQTVSYHCLDLLPHLGWIRKLGVDAVRLSPQSTHMEEIVAHWAKTIATGSPGATPGDFLVAPPADGYFTGGAGMELSEPSA